MHPARNFGGVPFGFLCATAFDPDMLMSTIAPIVEQRLRLLEVGKYAPRFMHVLRDPRFAIGMG